MTHATYDFIYHYIVWNLVLSAAVMAFNVFWPAIRITVRSPSMFPWFYVLPNGIMFVSNLLLAAIYAVPHLTAL